MAVAFDQEAHGTAKGRDFRQAGVAEFGGAVAEIAQTEKSIFIGCKFGEKPCCASVRRKQLYHWLVIDVAPFGNVCVATEMGAEFTGEQHC